MRLKGLSTLVTVLLMLSVLFCGCQVNRGPCAEPKTSEPLFDDSAPLYQIRNKPTNVVTDFNTLYMRVGDSVRFNAVACDEDGFIIKDCNIYGTCGDNSVYVDSDNTIHAMMNNRKTVVHVSAESSEGINLGTTKITVHVTDNAEYYGGFTFIGDVLIVNKAFPVPPGYDTGGILPEVQLAADRMIEDCKDLGMELWIQSGYRSYQYQQKLYAKYCREHDQKQADTFSARPGHSEHQSGLAFDLNTVNLDFGNTAQGHWVAHHAHEYGFIVRYPEGKESITGYSYEPWHLRYLGVELATAVFQSGLTIEEYFGINSRLKYDLDY